MEILVIPIGRSEIIGLEETQKYQRFVGSRKAVFTILKVAFGIVRLM